MNPRDNAIPSVGFQTSLDIARHQAYNRTTSVAGVKRPYEEGNRPRVIRSALADRPTLEPSPLTHLQPGRIVASEIRTLIGGPNEISEYSQRRIVSSTPGSSRNPILSLSHPRYDLPEKLIQNFTSLGINSIYPWQSSCLLGHGLLEGRKNLVYTAPTGGGKSLVADVLLLRRVIDDPTKKAILVLPYVALVQEKLRWLRRAVEGVEKRVDPQWLNSDGQNGPKRFDQSNIVRVGGFFGGSQTRNTWNDIDIAVCTIEKANSLVNSAVEENKISSLGIVVLDELHMLDDEHRGYILELMATKILSLQLGVQIIGMSATLSVSSFPLNRTP